MLARFTGSDERKAGLIAGVPLKRVGKPEEIAESIVFFANYLQGVLHHSGRYDRSRWWQNGSVIHTGSAATVWRRCTQSLLGMLERRNLGNRSLGWPRRRFAANGRIRMSQTIESKNKALA